ncbi:hypothetical protein FDECE_993 [Fusarium decemcellulare]|nr:hypothetical protein FDECE_993 [Fusarium decemcellulare]
MDNPRSSSTVATIYGWLSDEDRNLIGNLGLPDPYHWTNMMFWMQEMLWKYEAPYTDIGTLRLRFSRPHCVLCARSCPEARQGDEEDAHRPLVLPCGHIIGQDCYEELYTRYKEGTGPATCPGIHGIEDWHMTPVREDFDFGDEVVKNENTLLELFLTTPEPLRPSGTGHFPLTTRVHYWTRTDGHVSNATLDVIPEDEEPDEESKEDKKKNDLARLEAFMPPHIPLW